MTQRGHNSGQLTARQPAAGSSRGFFTPRCPNPWFQPAGTVEATSYYDTTPLAATLEVLVDFDRINSEHSDIRLSIGAVNVRSGNLTYFDTTTHTIGREHVMASRALPPGFPAVEIEGESYRARRRAHNIVHLIYRASGYAGDSKDYEFCRRSMEDHWRAGYYDAVHTLRHRKILERPTREAIATFGFAMGED